MVDRLGKTALEDLGLQATLQKVLDLQGQHVIETHAGLVEHTDAHETANEGVALEETLGVLVIELEELTGSTTNLGQDETNAPDLALVAETVLARELQAIDGWRLDQWIITGCTHLQLSIETSRLEGATRDLVAAKLSPKQLWGHGFDQHGASLH